MDRNTHYRVRTISFGREEALILYTTDCRGLNPTGSVIFIVFESVIPEKAEQCAAQRTAVSNL